MSQSKSADIPNPAEDGLTRGEFLKATGLLLLPAAVGAGNGSLLAQSKPPQPFERPAAPSQEDAPPGQILVSIFFPRQIADPDELDDHPFNMQSVQRAVPKENPITGIIREVLKNPTEDEFDQGYFPMDVRNIQLLKIQQGEEDKRLLVLLAPDEPPKIWLGPRSAEIFRRSVETSIQAYLRDPETQIEIYIKL